MQSYKIFIDSVHLGCLPNLIGCSMIYRYVRENGHELTHDVSKADFIIINSCGFHNEIQDICVALFRRYYSHKKKTAKIIMYGCLIKINKNLLEPLDLYAIGPDENHKLDEFFYTKKKFEAVAPYCDEETKNELTIEKKHFIFWRNMPFLLTKIFVPFSKKVRTNYKKLINDITQRNRIFVEISRGCTGNCSYCTIKKAKGPIRSRGTEKIIADIEKIYDSAKNVFLVADDCSCYGVDKDSNLIELVYEINNRFPDVALDLNYVNPSWLVKYSKEYIHLFKTINIGVVIIPMQSGSNKIIENMNRHYHVNNVIKIVDQIKAVSPHTSLYAHFILGYPGETSRDFLQTLSAARHFDYPVPFRYSSTKEIASAVLPYKKSKFVILLRWFIFILFINFVILYRLLTIPLHQPRQDKPKEIN